MPQSQYRMSNVNNIMSVVHITINEIVFFTESRLLTYPLLAGSPAFPPSLGLLSLGGLGFCPGLGFRC